jgi:hypothetical protein
MEIFPPSSRDPAVVIITFARPQGVICGSPGAGGEGGCPDLFESGVKQLPSAGGGSFGPLLATDNT